jgi:hypothetical protein
MHTYMKIISCKISQIEYFVKYITTHSILTTQTLDNYEHHKYTNSESISTSIFMGIDLCEVKYNKN